MQFFQGIFLALLSSQLATAALNEPCYGSGGVAGVCVSTATCSSSGGVTITGGCPRDPADVKCCSKPSCSGGNCRWSSDCAGTSVSNQCPGPSAFKCCSSGATGFGGYSGPSIPAVGACKAVSVDGARKVVAQFPGRVREIGCTRACTCSATPSSDHCCGKAIDLMCSDAGGTATISGRQIAEWVMNNRGTLNLKYVIWGQRIWNPSDSVGAWTTWRDMEDRGDITQNHWDHVHVSFN
ncbi:hypothetical protein BDV95DRAFT_607427 [Massariosphaeria phaeospora]|uniref:ARB-07466-like C-terminal domain-containing protein n=1 Tax=Massariosphaeria phaeospora TaxID=100035 RepID=A0A7C8I8Z1_9PLEO|nr:hypothetical protein BDV95DRAFT_607427 [Massariosphaeria phaeospora]